MTDTELDPVGEVVPGQPSKPSVLRRVAIAAGAVALVASGLFAANALLGDANSPEDPVSELLEAAESGDVLGMLGQLVPGERDALQGSITELVDELERLKVLDGADLDGVPGFEVTVEDLELDSDVDDDIAHVRIVGGEAIIRIDKAELPLGAFVKSLITGDLDGVFEDRGPIDSDDDFIATVKKGDRWYVSIGYTIAEQARIDAGVSFDDMGPGIEAKGADSPEGAVEALVAGVAGLDLERVIALLSPEMEPLQRYADLYLGDYDDAIGPLAALADIEIDSFELTTLSEDDGRAVIAIDSLEAHGSAGPLSFRLKDGCLTYTDPETGEEVEQCAADAAKDPGALPGAGALPGVDLPLPPDIGTGEKPEIGIVVVEVDGQWYVSPVQTGFETVTTLLRTLDDDDLSDLADYFMELMGSLAGLYPGMIDVDPFTGGSTSRS